MNSSLPVVREQSKEVTDALEDIHNSILEEQVYISYIAHGITITDTDNLIEKDRRYVLDKLLEIKKNEAERQQKAIEEAQAKREADRFMGKRR